MLELPSLSFACLKLFCGALEVSILAHHVLQVSFAERVALATLSVSASHARSSTLLLQRFGSCHHSGFSCLATDDRVKYKTSKDRLAEVLIAALAVRSPRRDRLDGRSLRSALAAPQTRRFLRPGKSVLVGRHGGCFGRWFFVFVWLCFLTTRYPPSYDRCSLTTPKLHQQTTRLIPEHYVAWRRKTR